MIHIDQLDTHIPTELKIAIKFTDVITENDSALIFMYFFV